MSVPNVTDLLALDRPVVAVDGELAETLGQLGDHVDATGTKALGLIVLPSVEVDFFQNLTDSVHLEDMDSIDEVIARAPELLVVGPSALLPPGVVLAITTRVLDALPGARVVCATGVRTDIRA